MTTSSAMLDSAPPRLPPAVFRSKNHQLVEAAIKCLDAERPMTLRQLYYRLVSAGVLGNKKSEYFRLGNVMTRLRESGQVPRSWIVDHVRARLKPSSWSGLADFADSVRACYRLDFWTSLPHHVEVFVEKDAVAGTIQPVTYKYDIGLQVCRGYASVSFAGEIADQWSQIKKPIFAYYLGDFDPSGFDIERDLRAKLERYCDPQRFFSTDHYQGDDHALNYARAEWVYWTRLGVTEDDFEDFNLIALPVKHKDNRAAGFVEEYGTQCAEIDALPPSELRRRVEEAILDHVDKARWERLQEIEAAEQETLNQYTGALAGEKVNLV